MLQCDQFYNALGERGISFFAGVPDSLLKDFCAYVADNTPKRKNIITANEGSAVALAAGYHLATKKIGLVYMQNSGQGNAVNPLVSLADPEVYSIPLLLLIGWRGEPGVHDEPQHKKQGMITLHLLDTLGIPYQILPDNSEQAAAVLDQACDYMKKKNASYALVVHKETFAPSPLKERKDDNKKESESKDNGEKMESFELSREAAIKMIVEKLGPRDIIVSTTGMTSRELFEYREACDQGHEQDFLTVGSMGHASQIALGIALEKPERNVYCIDGDGALIMHMGALAIIGSQEAQNFKHIVINNGAHDSVGGQPTAASGMDIPAIARACSYRNAMKSRTAAETREQLVQLEACQGPALLEICVHKGARKDLGRPTRTPAQNKEDFMGFLS